MDAHLSKETPQARIEWHLACIEARRNGEPLPPAPWEVVDEKKESPPRKERERASRDKTADELKLPKRPRVIESPPVKEVSQRGGVASEKGAKGVLREEGQVSRRDAQRGSLQKLRVPTRPHVVTPPLARAIQQPKPVTAPPREVVSRPPQSRPFNELPLRQDKEVVIDALLVDAGVPKYVCTGEGRVRSIFTYHYLLSQASASPALYAAGVKYDIGKQFQLNGSVAEALKIADVVIKVLDAPSKVILMAAKIEAQTLLTGVVQSRNLLFLKHRV